MTKTTVVDNPIVLINLQAKEGEWVFKETGLPYVGKYHQHKNGEYMIGIGVLDLNHEYQMRLLFDHSLSDDLKLKMLVQYTDHKCEHLDPPLKLLSEVY